ncbi:MAG TPA: RNA polymerase subunit sigma-70 [Candidatus Ventrisoma faecale]|nr:RNA polymerase subunit sigma-70 [Candidatus Ventrisoma faecale]
MHDDYFQIYLEELEAVLPFGEGEEEELLRLASLRDEQARSRLIEGKLKTALTWAREYEGKGLPAADLVQEANMALILCAQAYEGGDFDALLREAVIRRIEEAIEVQRAEHAVEEEMAARVNVLKDISQMMAEELGREATVEELAAKMKMTEEEIKDIMKLTLDALSVSGE